MKRLIYKPIIPERAIWRTIMCRITVIVRNPIYGLLLQNSTELVFFVHRMTFTFCKKCSIIFSVLHRKVETFMANNFEYLRKLFIYFFLNEHSSKMIRPRNAMIFHFSYMTDGIKLITCCQCKKASK